MLETDTLIIGGGLSGLSAGYTLEGKRSYFIAEREARAGGLAASIKKNGYTFDYSGHLLHLHHPETSKLICELLKDNINVINRDARVYINKKWIPFPFQSHLKGLPEKVRSECVREFLNKPKYEYTQKEVEVFSKWSERIFGSGITKHFMSPYNYKLLQYPLDKVTTEWCAPFVPVPNTDEVLSGAYGNNKIKSGYNIVFRYPKTGGIASLSNAFAKKLSGLRLGVEVAQIDLSTRTAEIKHFGTIKFKNLINTIPLNSFIKLIKKVPTRVCSAAGKLKSNTVYVLNIGIKKPALKFHWGYFPESKFPFYRCGISSNFSYTVAPRGHASFYVEIATDGRTPDFEEAVSVTANALKSCGMIKSVKQIEETMWLKIDPAYVIYDKERADSLPIIFDWLAQKDASSIGRYGAWKYSFMEENIKEGIETAKKILKTGN